MRALRQTILILLAVLSVAYIGTLIYQGSSTRHEPPVISCPEGVLEVSASDDESVLLAGVTASDFIVMDGARVDTCATHHGAFVGRASNVTLGFTVHSSLVFSILSS